jgi:hypothetical protein
VGVGGIAAGAIDPACHPALGVRRRPEQSVLHRVVREELRSFVDRRRAPDGEGLPRFVEGELQRYVGCGQLANGFLRVKCSGCGVERLVAFSCKGRGVCPSCGARRMVDTSARLIDRVLPEASYRQWVLTVPFALRYRLASDTAALTRVLRLFHQTLRAELRRRARRLGLPAGEPAAVTVVQRFGGALNLHVHFHAIVAEALFVRDGKGHRRVDLPPPTDAEVHRVLARLVRKLHADHLGPPPSDAAGPLALAQQRSMQSLLSAIPFDEPPTRARRRCARVDGFTLHANVFIPERNRDALERLCRYAARPSFSLSRMREDAAGKIRYALKRPLANGARELALDRDQLLERLAALVPPPRANLVRYFGVLAPGAGLRKNVVPRRPPVPQGRPPPGRMDWASLLARIYKVDVFTCAACGQRARVVAVIRDRTVIQKILRHLKLPTQGPVICPAREAAQRGLPFGQHERDLEQDAEVVAAALPSRMRAPTAPHRELPDPEFVQHGPEVDGVDEIPDVQRLPAWMRAGRRRGQVQRPEWLSTPRARRTPQTHWDLPEPQRAPDEVYPDEAPDMARMPAWMRAGRALSRTQASWSEDADVGWEAAWRRWDGIDPPAPEEDAEGSAELGWL